MSPLKIFALFFIFNIKNINSNSCNSIISSIKLETNKWYGDFQFHLSTSRNNGILDLNLIFITNNSSAKSEQKIMNLLNNEILDIKILANFNEFDSDFKNPKISDILINENSFCDITNERIVETTTIQVNQFEDDNKDEDENILNLSYEEPTTELYFNQENFDLDCGIIIPEIRPLVHYGQPTYAGQFPWHVALYYYTSTQLNYICGSTLINDGYLLTAAHCATQSNTEIPLRASNIVAFLGKEFLHEFTPHEQNSRIERIIIHEDYNPMKLYSDIALLKLKKRPQLTSYVSPVCLWSNDDGDINKLIGKLGTIPGWGVTEDGNLSEKLMSIKMPIISLQQCIWSNPNIFGYITSEKSFCAGFRNGSTVCNGDSGGGLVFEQNSKWFLRGIVSTGVGQKDRALSCSSKDFVVFTNVAKFNQWISEFLL